MRCLALAQAWQDDGGVVTFAVREAPDNIRRRLDAEDMIVREIASSDDAAMTADLAAEHAAEWAVIDGYQFGIQHQRAMKLAGVPLLWIDDFGHCTECLADLVLNQNISATEALYHPSADTRLLLGTDYTMLRREFRRPSHARDGVSSVARNVLVTFGGGDVAEWILLAINAIALLDSHDVVVRIAADGLSAEGAVMVKAAITRCELHAQLGPAGAMADLMSWADVAISATGSTSWELLFMRVPFVGVGLSENQRPIARRLRELDLATTFDSTSSLSAAVLGDAVHKLMNDVARRADVARRGRDHIDGKGVERVIAAMREARP
jgi:UDP-2,4-diacetamido-2,4,6-trideoxy-beta-L-altropyranose hydrolase